MLKIENLCKTFNSGSVNEKRALHGVSLTLNDGDFVTVIGGNGAGKSTLLNLLTHAGVLEEDLLFATLDPTIWNLKLSNGQEILLTDTVGFVRKLPHHLIDAFRSTLEEARYADFLIHVVDASDSQMQRQMEITYKTLSDLNITEKPILTIFNKMDLTDPDSVDRLADPRAKECIRTSLIDECSSGDLLAAIEQLLRSGRVLVERLYSYADAGMIQQIRRYGELISEEYTENGIYIEAYIPRQFL